jgi:hypothetical protein
VAYSRQDLFDRFPRLATEPHEITSPPAGYNCIAFVELRLDQYIDPEAHWPLAVPKPPPDEEADLPYYMVLFEHFGFEVCSGPALEDDYTKIAIYAQDDLFIHVAIQMPSGRWRSKAGSLHDLVHDNLASLEDCVFAPQAKPAQFMRRLRTDHAKDQEWGLVLPSTTNE